MPESGHPKRRESEIDEQRGRKKHWGDLHQKWLRKNAGVKVRGYGRERSCEWHSDVVCHVLPRG